MTFSELVRQMSLTTGYGQGEVEMMMESMVELVHRALRNGEDVKLRGLGTLHWQFRKKTRRRNPKTQEWVEVPEKYVLKFRPSGSLKDVEVI